MRLKSVLMICFFLLWLTCSFGCKSPLAPDPPQPPVIKYVDVEVKYQRVDDVPEYPLIHPDDSVYPVLLKGSISDLEYPENKMEKIGENLFFKKVFDVKVNYPRTRDSYPYAVYIIDNGFYNGEDTGTDSAIRAHLIWLNGKPMEKIRSGWKKEYLLVRVDQYGEAHEVDK